MEQEGCRLIGFLGGYVGVLEMVVLVLSLVYVFLKAWFDTLIKPFDFSDLT